MDINFTEELKAIGESIRRATRPVDSDEAFAMFEADLYKRMDGTVTGLSWPMEWPSLEKTMGPIEPGTLTVVGARTSVGKTVFAMQLLRSLAADGKSILYVTKELTVERIIRRHLCSFGASGERLRFGKPTNEDFLAIDAYQRAAKDWRVDYDHKSSSVQDVRDKLTGRQYDIIFIDYLQRLGYNAENEYGSLTNMVNDIQSLTLETNVPVMLLSQLRRAQSGKEHEEPHLSDTRGSGAVEERATSYILLHRRWEHDETLGARVRTDDGWFIVAKNADGESGKWIPWTIDGKRMLIQEKL